MSKSGPERANARHVCSWCEEGLKTVNHQHVWPKWYYRSKTFYDGNRKLNSRPLVPVGLVISYQAIARIRYRTGYLKISVMTLLPYMSPLTLFTCQEEHTISTAAWLPVRLLYHPPLWNTIKTRPNWGWTMPNTRSKLGHDYVNWSCKIMEFS